MEINSRITELIGLKFFRDTSVTNSINRLNNDNNYKYISTNRRLIGFINLDLESDNIIIPYNLLGKVKNYFFNNNYKITDLPKYLKIPIYINECSFISFRSFPTFLNKLDSVANVLQKFISNKGEIYYCSDNMILDSDFEILAYAGIKLNKKEINSENENHTFFKDFRVRDKAYYEINSCVLSVSSSIFNTKKTKLISKNIIKYIIPTIINKPDFIIKNSLQTIRHLNSFDESGLMFNKYMVPYTINIIKPGAVLSKIQKSICPESTLQFVNNNLNLNKETIITAYGN